jgi:hypothetical protein
MRGGDDTGGGEDMLKAWTRHPPHNTKMSGSQGSDLQLTMAIPISHTLVGLDWIEPSNLLFLKWFIWHN